MSDSPAVIIYSNQGNPVGVIYDGTVYRLQTQSQITDGYSIVGITDVAGSKALKVDVVKTVGSGSIGIGGTSSNFDDPFPTAGTAAGFQDGYFMRYARVFDLDTSPSTEYILGTNLRTFGSGGSIETGVAGNPLRTDPTGDTIQPVSGTVTANQGSFATLPNGWPVIPGQVNSSTINLVPSSATNVTLLAQNNNRIGVLIFNNSIYALNVKYGITASATSFSVRLNGGGYWEMPSPIDPTQLDGIWDNVDGYANVTELIR